MCRRSHSRKNWCVRCWFSAHQKDPDLRLKVWERKKPGFLKVRWNNSTSTASSSLLLKIRRTWSALLLFLTQTKTTCSLSSGNTSQNKVCVLFNTSEIYCILLQKKDLSSKNITRINSSLSTNAKSLNLSIISDIFKSRSKNVWTKNRRKKYQM